MEPNEVSKASIQIFRLSEATKRKARSLKTFNQQYPQHANKIPIWINYTYLKKQKPFVIDSEKTFHEFAQSVKAKLLHDKDESTRGCFFNVVYQNPNHNQINRILITEVNKRMGLLFQKYKTSYGWLQIQLQQESFF